LSLTSSYILVTFVALAAEIHFYTRELA